MITDELRAVAAKTECANGRCEKLYRGDLDHIADRIDAEHRAALEKLAAAVEEYEPSSIGCATVTITPRLDWSGVAADLRELVSLCERTKEVGE